VDLNIFIIGVFCLTDDWMSSQGPVRQRGPSPKLSDSEVITMEIVAEFLGMRAHVLVVWPGIVVRADVCGADVHDLHLTERLLEGMGRGWLLADRNYWSPLLREQLHDQEEGPMLMARFKMKNESEKERGLRWPRWLSKKCQQTESVFSQLVCRFNMKVVWARDTWHFSSRFSRKVLSHTMAVLFWRREGIPPTRFWELLTG